MTSILQLLFYKGSFTAALLQQLSLSGSHPTFNKSGGKGGSRRRALVSSLRVGQG